MEFWFDGMKLRKVLIVYQGRTRFTNTFLKYLKHSLKYQSDEINVEKNRKSILIYSLLFTEKESNLPIRC